MRPYFWTFQGLQQQLTQLQGRSSEAVTQLEEDFKNKANDHQRLQDELALVRKENTVSLPSSVCIHTLGRLSLISGVYKLYVLNSYTYNVSRDISL